jgi:peptidoglycan/xylan/chitin deacetylase (PgdA/CDA1 family)
MIQEAKAAVGHLMFASHFDAVLLGRTGTVVAFHRVHDGDDPTGLSIGRAMFERHCRFFKRHFRVIELAEMVNRLERGESLNRHLAITFDDGYRDNFENARPILEMLSLPATFFVVSQWIGSRVQPWWDRDHGVVHPWMTWDQVRALSRRGFHIGAHTRTHADLGAVSGAAAIEEIVGGRVELERQLGMPVTLFAYPYGGPQHLADANRALVKAAGFRCCCSCYGGIVRRRSDPFRIHRVAISPWYASPHQFGLELVREMSAA